MSTTRRKSLLLIVFLAAFSRLAIAQQAEPWLEDEVLQRRIEAACAVLREQKRLVTCEDLLANAGNVPGALPFAAAAVDRPRLEPADVHDLVRRSARIVGHYYLCTECDDWHFNPSSGFCVDPGGLVVTCAHVVPADEGMRRAFLVTADFEGHVWPVERVAAQDVWADLAVLVTAERGGAALPLAGGCRVGARVYCLSNPDGQFGYFSEGLVARRYRWREPLADDGGAVDRRGPAMPWIDVSCDFAKGSSGAPIVDATGAVVGVAQATLTVVYDEDTGPVDTQMVMRSAAPSESLRKLLGTGGLLGPVRKPK